MNDLLLYISEDQDLDRERVVQVLSSIEEIYLDNLATARRDPSVETIEGRYDHDGDSTLFTFTASSANSGDVWFRGSGPAAVDLAFRIQQGYPEPLRVVDQGYNFDLVISDYDSAADLNDAMEKASWADT